MTTPIPRPLLTTTGPSMAAIPDVTRPEMQRLCSNENPFGPSPLAIAAATVALQRGNEYPEDEGGDLMEAIAAHYSVPANRIRLGSGTDILLLGAVLAFAGPGDEVVFSSGGYSRYARNALIAGATPVAAPHNDYAVDQDAILSAITPHTRLVMIANPDNPSGAMLSLAAIKALHARLPANVLLTLDCAYAEYVRDPDYGDGGLALSLQAENVLVSHTFSKLFGMAGIRLGWVTSTQAILSAIGKAGPTFPVSIPAIAAGRAALADVEHQWASRVHNDTWLPRLTTALLQCSHLHVRPSQSNFILIDFPSAEMVRDCTAHLASNGILVRQFAPGPHESQMRISIGTSEALERAAELITKFIR